MISFGVNMNGLEGNKIMLLFSPFGGFVTALPLTATFSRCISPPIITSDGYYEFIDFSK